MRRWLILAALLLVPVAGQAQTIEYYGLDAIGSVRVVFDANGNVLSRADYAPFGEPLFPATGKQQQVYAGLFAEGEAGFDYAEARMYQPRTGRFNTVDPVYAGLFEPQAWNRYAYALNVPTLYLDPAGLTVRFSSGVEASCSDPEWRSVCGFWTQMNLWWVGLGDGWSGSGGGWSDVDFGGGGFSLPPTQTPTTDNPTPSPDPPGPTPPGPPGPDPKPGPRWTDWIPSVCSGGGFGYAGIGGGIKSLHAEGLALVQYDSTLGGAHGGLMGAGAGNYILGVESMRTWSDWQAHNSPIGLGGIEIPGASRRFGKTINIKSADLGGLAQYEGGDLSIGLYGGLTLGSNRTFGGGAYVTLSWNGCQAGAL